MGKVFVFCLLVLGVPQAFANPSDEIAKVKIREVPDSGDKIVLANKCSPDNAVAAVGNIAWDDIVAIGRTVWDVVVANKPILETESPTVHAIPRVAKCWSDLETWKAPITRSYEVVYENKLGIDVVTFRFRLQFAYGGSYQGHGRYLANVTVIPALVDVSWGFKFNAKLMVNEVILNHGTKKDPVAGLDMNLVWNVSSVVKENESSVHFAIDGNGGIRFDN